MVNLYNYLSSSEIVSKCSENQRKINLLMNILKYNCINCWKILYVYYWIILLASTLIMRTKLNINEVFTQ